MATIWHPKYRADIDGLRAIAVLSVVLFHAFPTGGRGGFIGVDIFFVISGYLISSIIFRNLDSNTFSFYDFYSRRAKRIFPALSIVLATSFFIAWFILLADEFALLGKHMVAGSAFLSNFLLWKESGYFDVNSDMKPLLHLWSLGIEEQYYLLWPAILWLAAKTRTKMLPLLVLLTVGSFLLNLIRITNYPVEVFYLPATRFWELLLGSFLAYRSMRQVSNTSPNSMLLSNAKSVVGLLLIGVGLIVIKKESEFPGWWALLPTFGTVLVISAGSSAWFNKYILSNRVMVWVGLISFPLYLWHWPLLVFARIAEGQLPSRGVRVGIVAVSIIFAWLTYRYIEKNMRSGVSKRKTVIAVWAMIFMCLLGAVTYFQNGFPNRDIYLLSGGKISANNINIDAGKSPSKTWSCRSNVSVSDEFNENCIVHTVVESKTKIVVWGDSHAYAWSPVFKEIARRHNYELYIVSTTGCPPIIGVRRSDGVDGDKISCRDIGASGRILESIVKIKPDLVILTSWWSLYSHGLIIDGVPYKDHHYVTTEASGVATLESSQSALLRQIPATLKEFKDRNIPLLLFKNPPVMNTSVANQRKSLSEIEPTIQEHLEKSRFTDDIFNTIDSLSIYDPAAKLCVKVCSAKINDNWLYVDFTHLSQFGAMYFDGDIEKKISDIVRR